MLSTNSSDTFLQVTHGALSCVGSRSPIRIPPQKLAHLDQRERERERSELSERVAFQTVNNNQTKPEEIVLLEKQGRCSQKLRNSLTSNLATVSQIVGQNMTDISNIDSGAGRQKVKKNV